MTKQRLIKLFSAILVVGLLLASEAALAVVIQAGRPSATAEDQALFKKVKVYLEKKLKDCQQCNITVTVENGQVRLLGVAPVGSLPHLRKIKGAIGGVKGLNLDKVQFNPQPHPRAHPGGAQFDPEPHPRSRAKDALEMRGLNPQPEPPGKQGIKAKDALEMRGLNPQPEPPGKEK